MARSGRSASRRSVGVLMGGATMAQPRRAPAPERARPAPMYRQAPWQGPHDSDQQPRASTQPVRRRPRDHPGRHHRGGRVRRRRAHPPPGAASQRPHQPASRAATVTTSPSARRIRIWPAPVTISRRSMPRRRGRLPGAAAWRIGSARARPRGAGHPRHRPGRRLPAQGPGRLRALVRLRASRPGAAGARGLRPPRAAPRRAARAQDADVTIVGSPGCYPTTTLLGLYPLARAGLIADVVVDAKSGASGAGRSSQGGPHVQRRSTNWCVPTA